MIRNSVVFDFSKRTIQTPSCFDLFTSIISKKDAFQLAIGVVRKLFKDLEETKQEELYESFPRTLLFSQFSGRPPAKRHSIVHPLVCCRQICQPAREASIVTVACMLAGIGQVDRRDQCFGMIVSCQTMVWSDSCDLPARDGAVFVALDRPS